MAHECDTARWKSTSDRARLDFETHLKARGGCGKTQCGEEKRPQGLKPSLISHRLRGPEGPLFHSDAHIRDFFRSLPGNKMHFIE